MTISQAENKAINLEPNNVIAIRELLEQVYRDGLSNSLKIINYNHHEIHDGNHYFFSEFDSRDTDETTVIAITTPTGKQLHFEFSAEGTTQTEFRIYRGASISDGSSVVAQNNNQNSSNTSGATIKKDPTINSLGTLIFAQSRGKEAANPSKADGSGIVDRDKEIMLLENTTYLFHVTSKGDGNIISYIADWYEHTPVTEAKKYYTNPD